MHGMINRAIQGFMCDAYGKEAWQEVARVADLGFTEFEAMLTYDDALTDNVINAIVDLMDNPRDQLLEDIGTYLVANPRMESLRRLLRFGGVSFVEFLHSLDDLPDRARLAVSDLDLPKMELREHNPSQYSLTLRTPHPGPKTGWGHIVAGLLRAMADDYGALVFMEYKGGKQGVEIIDITLIEHDFSAGKHFDLGAINHEKTG